MNLPITFARQFLSAGQAERPAALRRLGPAAAPLLTFLGILVVWELSCRVFHIPDFVLPSPSSIFIAGASFGALRWWQNFLATIEVVLIGYAVSIAISLPLAVMLTRSKLLSQTILPLLIVIQSTPIVAVAPLIVVTLGTGILPRVVITFMISFMPMVISTATGLDATPEELIELSRSLRAGSKREYLQIRLPCAVPYIFSALKVSITLAVIGAVVGEFVSADKGLGYLIMFSTSFFKVPQAFAALAVLVTSSLILFQLVVLVQRLVFPWSLPKSTRS